jgi:putative glutamine amidotransferase
MQSPARDRPRIGVSANVMAPRYDRRFYVGKALQYAEEGMLDWIWREGGLPLVLPVVGDTDVAGFVEHLDGLLLSGGEDVSPELYDQRVRRPEWAGNPRRDRFELALFEAFAARDRPILGVCRGHQVLNVALGGTLHQDLVEDGRVTDPHRDPVRYCRLRHDVRLRRPGYLFDLYGVEGAAVNTVHHQAVDVLGDDLEVLAESHDGLVEAVRHRSLRWAVGVQWHPEWILESDVAEGLLAPGPLMQEFLAAASAPHEH